MSNIIKAIIYISFIIFSILLLYYLLFGNQNTNVYTACYVCEDKTHVKYEGNDSYFLRKEAERIYKCKVISRVWKCESDKKVKEQKWETYKKQYGR